GLLSGTNLHIVGDNVSDEIRAYASANVNVAGHLPDVEPLLRTCRVFVAPIRFGAGVKGKIGEAMSYGVPVVTTSIGAEGFGLTHRVNIMIGDDPQSFADNVVALYTQPELWQRIALNSRRHIAENFAPGVISQTINDSIKDMISA